MRTFITRRAAWLPILPVVVALGLLGVAVARTSGVPVRNSGFTWLRPRAVPPGWSVATTATGARLAYPAGWRPIETDPGTASVAPRGRAGAFAGYLNATPRGGDETLANWPRFRIEHV